MRPLIVALLFLPGCADLTSAPDGGSSDAGSPCTTGETRCVGQRYELCSDGRFVESFQCDSTHVCVSGLGCVDCDPAAGKVCFNNDVHACDASGRVGATLEPCLGQICAAGACRDSSCAVGARLVYVVDADYRLLSFDPAAESNHFTLIATLSCPGAGVDTPFSMSVDRSARAWVLYSSGDIYWVDTKDGACSASPFQSGQQGYLLFGMGFVSDQPGSAKEKLYIAGADQALTGANDKLGYIDPATLKITVIGATAAAEHSPELTGTGNAELYAYHPGTIASFVARMDKQTAKVLQQWPVPPLTGQVTAWAFAHWGGKFYIFVTDQDLFGVETSRVLVLDPVSGKASTFLPSIPYKIVGAGVSTCAPTIE